MNADLIQYAPYAVGFGVALLVIALLARRRKNPRDDFPPPPTGSSRSSEWTLPEQSFADRRGAVRREGPAVKVLVACPSFKNGVDRGYVLDRSTGGLRIALGAALPAGSTLQVRAHHAPETTPWVTVIVRNSRDCGKHFELGCEFDKTPPWNVLLLFG